MSVFLVLKTVFFYSPQEGIQEQDVMLVGYARVSTMDQNPALQTDALRAAGCGRIFTEKASGAHRDRPELQAALDFLREGDTLVVWKLSRLARSIAQVIRTATELEQRSIALRVLSRNIDTSTPRDASSST
ncbi:MAG: recombinase family protein [Albidovulum sp.]|nr:recombinase family protein [Albidovulum sp.]